MNASKLVFVVMRISPLGEETDVDRFYKQVIAPSAAAFGLHAKPVDLTDGPEGISRRALELIEASRFVVCDLTHERPNCYFEGGYAMAKGLPCVWTARKDHDPRRPMRNLNDPKVHFDLDGLRITYWSEERFDHARKDLKERMQYALEPHAVPLAALKKSDHAPRPISVGRIAVDWERHDVTVEGKPLRLPPKEFALLRYLIESDGKVVSRERLIKNIWGDAGRTPADSRTVDQHVARLRRKLGKASGQIQTLPTAGYKFTLG